MVLEYGRKALVLLQLTAVLKPGKKIAEGMKPIAGESVLRPSGDLRFLEVRAG